MVSEKSIFATFFVVLRDWVTVRHVNPEVQGNGSHCSGWSSRKCKAISNWSVFICVSASLSNKGGRYTVGQWGATEGSATYVWRAIAPLPPWIHHWVSRFLRYHWKFDTALWYAIVATSPVVLRWLCDSPRTGCAWRTTPYIYVERTSNNRVIVAWKLCRY